MASSFKIVSANIGTSMLSIADILKTDKPELLFLQEVTSPTSVLQARVAGLGYGAECNVDSLHPTRPGTAIVWKQTIIIGITVKVTKTRWATLLNKLRGSFSVPKMPTSTTPSPSSLHYCESN